MYSRVLASGFGYGWPYHPSTTCGPDAPRPSTNRPPLRWSRVNAAIAVAAGGRADIWMMVVASRTREVPEAYQASGATASEPYASAVHTESRPSRSASATSAAASAGGPPLQYPSVTPSFMRLLTRSTVARCPAGLRAPLCRSSRRLADRRLALDVDGGDAGQRVGRAGQHRVEAGIAREVAEHERGEVGGAGGVLLVLGQLVLQYPGVVGGPAPAGRVGRVDAVVGRGDLTARRRPFGVEEVVVGAVHQDLVDRLGVAAVRGVEVVVGERVAD